MTKTTMITAVFVLLTLCTGCGKKTDSSSTQTFTSEGSKDAPQALTVGTTRDGSVKVNEKSYYKVDLPAGSYTLTVTGISAEISLYVFGTDSTYNTLSQLKVGADDSAADRSQAVTGTGVSYYIRVTGPFSTFSSAQGATFKILMKAN